MMERLSPGDVRAALLAAQGISASATGAATKADVLAMIRRMHLLQIDTISVVARSPYFVLWTRLGDYDPKWLEDLLAEGALFEYWSHAACWLPSEDYGIYRRRMLDRATPRFDRWLRWVDEHRPMVDGVRARLVEKGPLRSADFERTDGRKGGGWWDWKEEKLALEILFDIGDLMVSRRQGFQRLYDFRERVRPDWDDAHAPSADESARTLISRAVRALGVGRADWARTYVYTATGTKRETEHICREMVASGELLAVEVDGWKVPGLVHPDNLGLVGAVAGRKGRKAVSLLSPFDPIVSDRTRAVELFNFDYKIECYTPGAQRRYGYFTLPILFGDALVGRLDAKAHRKDGVFEVKSLHIEPGFRVTDEFVARLRETLDRCAQWHKTPELVVRRSDPPELAGRLSE